MGRWLWFVQNWTSIRFFCYFMWGKVICTPMKSRKRQWQVTEPRLFSSHGCAQAYHKKNSPIKGPSPYIQRSTESTKAQWQARSQIKGSEEEISCLGSSQCYFRGASAPVSRYDSHQDESILEQPLTERGYCLGLGGHLMVVRERIFQDCTCLSFRRGTQVHKREGSRWFEKQQAWGTEG